MMREQPYPAFAGLMCPSAQTLLRSSRIFRLMFVVAAPVSLVLLAEASVATAPEAKGWATSAFGSAADTRPLDSLDLGAHLDRCRRSRGTLFPALCLADAVESFLAPRMFTTLAAVALVIGAGFGVL